jgi:hypothetical protein
MRAALILSLLLLGCSSITFSYRSPGRYIGGTLLGTGTYLMETLLEPANGEPQRFNMIFSRKAYASVLEALSSNGKKLFQVREPMVISEEPIFQDPTPSEPYQEFYRTFRPLILLADNPEVPSKVVIERYSDGRPRTLEGLDGRTVHIDEYDWSGHAFRVSIDGMGWTAHVALREYDYVK